MIDSIHYDGYSWTLSSCTLYGRNEWGLRASFGRANENMGASQQEVGMVGRPIYSSLGMDTALPSPPPVEGAYDLYEDLHTKRGHNMPPPLAVRGAAVHPPLASYVVPPAGSNGHPKEPIIETSGE